MSEIAPEAPVREYRHEGVLLALVVSSRFSHPGVTFFSPHEFSQQLAYMAHPAGKRIAAHVHNPVKREVNLTQEVLIIRKGRLKVDLYSAQGAPVCSFTLAAGDVILLAAGGHGFEVLEDLEMIEVKQGPYSGDQDKTPLAVENVP